MYSRYPDRPTRPLRLPEHYSGCAFRQDPARDERDEPERNDPALIPVPFTEAPAPQPPPPPPAPPKPPCHTSPAPACELFGGVLPALPGGASGDELLLIGLILLLARSGEGADVLPWLALLLFCK